MMNHSTRINAGAMPSALDTLNAYLAWECPAPSSDESASDEAYRMIRDFLDQPEALTPEQFPRLTSFTLYSYNAILAALIELNSNEFRRDELSTLAMELSLCPMHFCDWASCFDDEDPECAQIRSVFPYGHDT